MSETTEYTSLKKLVGNTFTVKSITGSSYKKWDAAASKFLESETPEQGYSKKYRLATDKGVLELGTGQLGNMLEATLEGGKADINHKTFTVASNGKEGMDVRYYLNVTESPAAPQEKSLDDLL